MSDERTQQGHALVVEEAQPQTKRPPLYQVVRPLGDGRAGQLARRLGSDAVAREHGGPRPPW